MTHFWIRLASAALLSVGLVAGQAAPAAAGVFTSVTPAVSDHAPGIVLAATKKKPAEPSCKTKAEQKTKACKAAAAKEEKAADKAPTCKTKAQLKTKACKTAAAEDKKAAAKEPVCKTKAQLKSKACKAAAAEEKKAAAAEPTCKTRAQQKTKACRAAAEEKRAERAPPPCKGRHCKAEAAPRDEAPAKSSSKATPGVIAGGAVVSAEGPPASYKVKSGDTLEGVADKMGTTQKQLIADNRLKKPYHLKLGQVLKGPATHGRAYVVQSGDTLYAIARRFSVDADDLASYNGIRMNGALKSGQKIKLPPGFKDRGVPKPAVVTQPPHPSRLPPAQPAYPEPSYQPPPTQPQPYQPPVQQPQPLPLTREPQELPRDTTPTPGYRPPPQQQPYTPPVQTPPSYRPPPQNNGVLPQAAPPVDEATISSLGRGRFAWPVRGQVISTFGPKGGGQRNDGLDIAAPGGTPVFAAADGEVVYSGDQVPGFGNLVLIKHQGGWVTAYAHLGRTDVKMRQQVTQGAQIGTVGNTGMTGDPMLHFEVRYTSSPKEKARAVNPNLVLPQ